MLPDTFALFDRHGQSFGWLRLSPREDDPKKGECIFDVRASDAQQTQSEVRWLLKRHYEQASEHRFRVDKSGHLVITKGDFRMILEPEEGAWTTRPPAPPVTATAT